MTRFTGDEVQKGMNKAVKEALLLEFTRDYDLGTMLLEELLGPRPKPTRIQRFKWWLLEWAERILGE